MGVRASCPVVTSSRQGRACRLVIRIVGQYGISDVVTVCTEVDNSHLRVFTFVSYSALLLSLASIHT
jgi:hypothetical protein